MAKLLYVESSPRKDRSASIEVAHTFIDAYRQAHPADTVETMDLWKTPLPAFDGDVINAKYRILHGQPHRGTEAAAWRLVTETFSRFAAADKYLFSLPMWNFGIPYKLKHFIDIIVQPGLSFSFSPETGYQGLLTGKPAAVLYARGGQYSQPPAQAMDFQKPYLEHILGFMGITDVRSILIEGTLSAPDAAAKAIADAKTRAAEVARGL